MLEVFTHDDAEEDLEVIRVDAPGAYRYLVALIDQLTADQDLADRLTQEDFGLPGVDPFNVDKVEVHQDAGRNIWRVKTWTLDGYEIFYRVIYAFDEVTHDHYILGIVPRTYAYDCNHPRIRKLIEAYQSLELGGN